MNLPVPTATQLHSGTADGVLAALIVDCSRWSSHPSPAVHRRVENSRHAPSTIQPRKGPGSHWLLIDTSHVHDRIQQVANDNHGLSILRTLGSKTSDNFHPIHLVPERFSPQQLSLCQTLHPHPRRGLVRVLPCLEPHRIIAPFIPRVFLHCTTGLSAAPGPTEGPNCPPATRKVTRPTPDLLTFHT